MSKTSIVIYDMVTGRVPGGHQEDYLAALEEALGQFRPLTFAPFRPMGGGGQPQIDRSNRLRRWTISITAFLHYLNVPQRTLILVPNPSPLDFVLFALAAMLSRRRGKGTAIFMMRRDAAGIVGAGLRARILDRIVRWLARDPAFAMVSDTRVAIDHWAKRTGRRISLISIPVRQPPATSPRAPNALIVIGLIGAFRLEKGAEHYNRIISTALRCAKPAIIACQLSPNGLSQREQDLATDVARKWVSDLRVEIHCEHLDADAFAALLYSIDILVLPYDTAKYGPGTSGLMFEALAAGLIVLATRIPWGMREFADHPAMIWLDDLGTETLAQALLEALGRVGEMRGRNGTPVVASSVFAESWFAAIAAQIGAPRTDPAIAPSVANTDS